MAKVLKFAKYLNNIHVLNLQLNVVLLYATFLVVVSIPLVYTQVVTLATYSFFAAGIFGRQCIDDGTKDFKADIYFPSWTVLQLLFYMGLLKVCHIRKLKEISLETSLHSMHKATRTPLE